MNCWFLFQAKIISQTVCCTPGKRPTASELLKIICSKDKPASTSSIICEKDKLIHQLRKELAAKDNEIIKLRKQLSKLNIKTGSSKSVNSER